MKKQLIITTGIILSACSNTGYQNGGNAYNAPQYNMGGQYQANGQIGGHYQNQMGNQFHTMMGNGCAPKSISTSCTKPRPAPCIVPAPIPAPCAVTPPVSCAVPTRPCSPTNVIAGHMGPSVNYQSNRNAYGGYGLRQSYMSRKQSYVYGEIGGVNYDAGKTFGGVQSRLGYQSDSFWGAEAEGSLGLIGKKFTDDEIKQDIRNESKRLEKYKRSYAGFAVARAEISKDVNLIGRIGYHNTRVSRTATEQEIKEFKVQQEQNAKDGSKITIDIDDRAMLSTSVEGLAVGVGAEKKLSPVDSIRADLTAYDMGDDYRPALSLGYQRKF